MLISLLLVAIVLLAKFCYCVFVQLVEVHLRLCENIIHIHKKHTKRKGRKKRDKTCLSVEGEVEEISYVYLLFRRIERASWRRRRKGDSEKERGKQIMKKKYRGRKTEE